MHALLIACMILTWALVARTEEPNRLVKLDPVIDDLPEWMLRRRRVAGTRKCGPRIFDTIKAVCGGFCTIFSGEAIGTHCCTISCDEEYLRKVCCPKD
ncbi:unnamed protein product [Caenorhabditis sp. 36 PRJEB53466]|nr:unnamed protein product [Caenorhabditis sp. 36 PRJEB53466]